MDALGFLESSSGDDSSSNRFRGEMSRLLAGTIAVSLLFVAMFAAVRRALGAFDASQTAASNPMLWVAAPSVAGLALAARWLWRVDASRLQAKSATDWGIELGLSAAVAAGAVALVPWRSPFAMLLLLVPLLAEEVWAWWPGKSRNQTRFPVHLNEGSAPQTGNRQLPKSPITQSGRTPNERISLEMTRCEDPSGQETIRGTLLVPFAASQRTANAHLAFCPPFAQPPEVEVRFLEGPEARIKTAQIVPHGARLELKLAAKCEQPADVHVEFTVRGRNLARRSMPADATKGQQLG